MTSDDPADKAKDIRARTVDAGGRVGGTLSDAAASAADRASTLAGTVGDRASGMYQRVREGASDLGDRLPGTASDAVDAGQRLYARGNDRLARQVGSQPIEALLLAGAIGYLVGWAANRS